MAGLLGAIGSIPAAIVPFEALPFLNLSADTEQEYFSAGLADTLLHRLTQIKDLRMVARTSSFKFKGNY